MLGANGGGAPAAAGEEGLDLGEAIAAAAGAGEDGGAGGEDGGEGGAGAGEDGEGARPGEGSDGGEGGAAGGDEQPLSVSEQRALLQEVTSLRTWREEQENRFAEDREAQEKREAAARNQPPAPISDEEFSKIEARAGFVRTKDKDTGEERMAIEPRKLIEFVSGMVEFAVNKTRQDLEGQLHDNVSSLRIQDVFAQLEKDPTKKFVDIGQYRDGIRAHLKKRFRPQDHTNPEYIKEAYFIIKGQGLKDTIKRVEQRQVEKKRVIHPAGGGGGAAGGGNGKPPVARDSTAAAFLAKSGW
jgi:hypothetical protein